LAGDGGRREPAPHAFGKCPRPIASFIEAFLRQDTFGLAALCGQAKTPSLAHALEHFIQGVSLLISPRGKSILKLRNPSGDGFQRL
jgi:hypothetical protein